MNFMFRTRFFLPIVFMLLVPLLNPLSAYCKEKQAFPFTIQNEIRISSQDMDCDYALEDWQKLSYNFEYPKLIIMDNANPMVAFVDIQSKKLVLSEVTDGNVKVVHTQSGYNDEYPWKRWPIIFIKDNKMYLAVLAEMGSVAKITISSFDRDTGQLIPYVEQEFNKLNGGELWGIYPCNDKFLLTGHRNYTCLRYVFAMMAGAMSDFNHNVSWIMDGSKELAYNRIEETGCYNVDEPAYDASTSGKIHAAWLRNTRKVFSPRHDQMVYYSMTKDGMTWTEPLKLYAIKNTEEYRYNLSLSSAGDSAMVLWKSDDTGIFFFEVRDGRKIESIRLKELKYTSRDATGNLLPPPPFSPIKIASDKDGNAYVLWAQNSGRDYQMFFKARMNGQWTEETLVNRGRGDISEPDMKIDKSGDVHIVYTKLLYPNEPKVHSRGCYYMKLERQKTN